MKTTRQLLAAISTTIVVICLTGCDTGLETAGSSFDAVNYNRRAQVYYNSGDISTAKEELRRSLDADYENPISHYYLGMCHEAESNLEKAIYEYSLAVRFAPSMEVAQMTLVETLEKDNQHEESLNALKNWLTPGGMELQEYMRIGGYFQKANMPDHAVLAWESAAKVHSHNVEPCIALADFYRGQNMSDKEVEWLKRAARVDPYYPGLSRRLGERSLKLNIPQPQQPVPTPAEKRLRELEL